MKTTISPDKRIYELRKTISILEWDLPNLKNSELKTVKEKELMFCKAELQSLLEKTKLLVC